MTFPYIVACIVCIFMLPWFYWAIVDRDPVASSVSEVISPKVMQGDFLQLDYDVTWSSTCDIIAFRYIIDEMQVEWPISAQQRIVSAGPSRFTIRIPVPTAAAPGNAVYRGTLRFAFLLQVTCKRCLRRKFFETFGRASIYGMGRDPCGSTSSVRPAGPSATWR